MPVYELPTLAASRNLTSQGQGTGSDAGNYAAALAGTGFKSVSTTNLVGQWRFISGGGSVYLLGVAFLGVDLTGFATVNSIQLQILARDNFSGTDFDLELQPHTWSDPVVTGHWPTTADLAAGTTVAKYSTVDLPPTTGGQGMPVTGTYNSPYVVMEFVDTSPGSLLATAPAGSVSKFRLSSSRHRLQSQPGGLEYVTVITDEAFEDIQFVVDGILIGGDAGAWSLGSVLIG